MNQFVIIGRVQHYNVDGILLKVADRDAEYIIGISIPDTMWDTLQNANLREGSLVGIKGKITSQNMGGNSALRLTAQKITFLN